MGYAMGMLSLITSLLAATPPAVPQDGLSVRYRHGQLAFHVQHAAGVHVAEAPSDVVVVQGELRSSVSVVGSLEGVSLPVRAGPFHVEASFSLCEDDGSLCRLLSVVGDGVVSGRRGDWDFGEQVVAPVVVGQGRVATLYDFGAVWCPPCNLLAAEVLDDPGHQQFLPAPVVRVDVDRPESWVLKNRYQVGGYPTMIAVDAQGVELARLVGYPGEAAMVGWLGSLGTVRSLAELEGGVSLSGAEAAVAARRLVEAEKPDAARRYLAGAADGVDLRVARLLLDPSAEDARYLLDHHAPAGDWIYAAIDVAPDLRSALAFYVIAGDAGDAAGYLDAIAGDDPLLAAAAVALIKTKLSGDPLLDKGWYAALADLYVRAGVPDEALRVLGDGVRFFPEEFTFHHALGRTLLDLKRLSEAELEAREALRTGYGDQRLRAALLLGKVLGAEGRAPEAIACLDAILVEIPEPPEGVVVRTSRYRKQVQMLRDSLGGGK